MSRPKHPNARCSWLGYVVKRETHEGALMYYRWHGQNWYDRIIGEARDGKRDVYAGLVYQGA